jgi:hypothetical protein
VNINKKQFNYGDTIVLDYDFKYNNKLSATSTLNLWIEDLNTHSIWKYRYPLMNGSLSHSLIVGQDLLKGKYAFNFMIQKYIFGFYGHVVNYNKKTKGLNFIMLGKKKGVFMDIITPNDEGDFITPRLIFEDTSKFIFSSIENKYADLYIDAITPLDSTFKSSITQTILINIGDSNSKNNEYKFEQTTFGGDFTLAEAVVKSTKKKQIENFDAAYSSSSFKSPFAKIIDGIENDEIAKSFDIVYFLQFRIAGLKVNQIDPRLGDGSIMTFIDKEKNPKWSFAKLNENNLVSRVEEKLAISEFATVGIYLYSKGKDFVNYTIEMIINNDRVNNEFYTCPTYNYAIKDGAKIGIYNIDINQMNGIGTPEDLNIYLSKLGN